MFLKSKYFQLCLAFGFGIIVLLLPRPEGTKFKISGDMNQEFLQQVAQHFTLSSDKKKKEYIVEAKQPGTEASTAAFLEKTARDLNLFALKHSLRNLPLRLSTNAF